MRKVRFLVRAWVDGRMWEPGEEGHIHDAHFLNAHMVDVETETPGVGAPGDAAGPVFLDHTGDAQQNTAASGAFNPALATS